MNNKLLVFLLFISQNVWAEDLINSNVINGCVSTDLSMPVFFKPQFTPITYNCPSGYFLPSNTPGCAQCLSWYDCAGGTYTFNETVAQGLKRKTIISENVINGCGIEYIFPESGITNLKPAFKPNQYDCDAGYYLPADSIECVTCPVDSYCTGGTYTFSETVAQGITTCGAGTYAPAGMWEPEQCGRILHVGDGFVYLRSTKKTEHALHVDLDHDGIADYFGNMTTLDVPMSRETQRKLKVRWDNVTYSIYDDSVDLSLYE